MIDLPTFEGSRPAQERATEITPGELTLQRCGNCGEYQYPAREICQYCLSADLQWRRVSGAGTAIAAVPVHASMHPFFSEHAPWRICWVALEAGPRVIAHAGDGAIGPGTGVEVSDVQVGPTHCVLVAKIRT